jgi:Arc/MetJ-type ribon-helix-helix transcriptional regulator
MTTLSIPVSGDLEKFIEKMVRDGKGANKADVVRRALRQMSEDEVVETVLRAQGEPTLRGDLRELMKKFK